MPQSDATTMIVLGVLIATIYGLNLYPRLIEEANRWKLLQSAGLLCGTVFVVAMAISGSIVLSTQNALIFTLHGVVLGCLNNYYIKWKNKNTEKVQRSKK